MRSIPFARRSTVAFVGVVLLLGAVSLPAPAQGASSSSAENSWVNATLGSMTLEQKVGQLFVVNCFGASVRDPDPAAVKANQQAYGLDNFEQVIVKYHL